MKRLIFFSLAVLLMTGCKQQDDESMFPDRPDVREYVVSTDEAENAAFYFLYMTDNQVQTRNAVRDVKDAPVIKKKFTIEGYNGKPAMHVINYEKGGFTVISGDKRLFPIIAFSDDGYWDNNLDNYPDGLAYWIDCMKNEIIAMDEQGIEQDKELKNLWETFVPSVTTRIITPPSHPCEDPESYEKYIAPLIYTNWHQESPYNDSIPEILCDGITKKPLAGCVPIAVAQIARYHQYPTNYQWTSMTNGAIVASLIKDIHDYYNSISAIIYYCDNSTGVLTDQRSRVFTQHWGYSSCVSTTLRDNFDSTNPGNVVVPLLLTGMDSVSGRHSWICDGFMENIYCYNNDGIWQWYTQAWFHMNWGWGGNDNCWCIENTTYSGGTHSFSNIGCLKPIP